MSRWHQTYRSAVCALVIAFLLAALPAMMIAQSSEEAPKAELFVGYQWLNPGGNIPDFNVPPMRSISLRSRRAPARACRGT